MSSRGPAKWRLLLAALGAAGAVVLLYVERDARFLRSTSSELSARAKAGASAPPEATPAPEARGPRPRRLPLPAPVTTPQVPVWSDPNGGRDEAEQERMRRKVEHTAELRSGRTAILSASRPSYPASAPVDLRLKLMEPDGEPLVGRQDLEAIIVDATGGHAPVRDRFVEDVDHPGSYGLSASIPADWPRVSIITSFSETGDPNDPQPSAMLQVQVAHDAPAAFIGDPRALFRSGGLEVTVTVASSRAGQGALRAELIDGDGASFGEAVGTSELAEGTGGLRLVFPGLTPSDPRVDNHAFYLAHMALYLDSKWSDFNNDPVPVVIE